MLKTKVTIGIPAYNEEANIGRLIKSLLKQKTRKISIDKIIIYSDGSTDKTDEEAGNNRSNKVVVVKSKIRAGQASAQNKIFEKADTDILVLINADVLINDNSFIEKLVTPILTDGRVGLTSAQVLPVSAHGYFEKIISQSHVEKNKLFESLGNDNIYLCHGRARAFSKKLYKNFKFPRVIAEDAYSYLINQKMSLKFKYVKGARVYFRSPGNLHDHIKQSRRFSSGISELKKHFSDGIERSFDIPKNKNLLFVINLIKKSPFLGISFFLITFYSRAFLFLSPGQSHIWSVSASSKRI
jgi:glycosyltransferase involved in cell wall biosynthesis